MTKVIEINAIITLGTFELKEMICKQRKYSQRFTVRMFAKLFVLANDSADMFLYLMNGASI